jgi:transcriptional regulator with XRE-family HTH domain
MATARAVNPLGQLYPYTAERLAPHLDLFRRRVRWARRREGWGLIPFAARIGINYSGVAGVEVGRTVMIGLKTAVRLAHGLQASMNWLAGIDYPAPVGEDIPAVVPGDPTATARARVRWARHRRGWSQGWLADYSGLSASTVEHLEHGTTTAGSLATFLALAHGLEVSLDWLLGLDYPAPETTSAPAMLMSNN